MFIKHGGDTDGKIVNVIDEEQLTDDQKKSVKKVVKQSSNETDTSQEKNSGS